MFKWNIFLKCCIFCGIWTQCSADQDMPVVYFKSPFDPSTFSAKIIDCHSNCGDKYTNCFFKNCDFNVPELDAIMLENQDTSDNLFENKPSFWSRFLNIFTFGYFGSSFHGANRSLRSGKHSDEEYEDFNTSPDIVQVCLNNCTSVFRECYNTCICDDNHDFHTCKPKMNEFDQGYQNNDSTYHFDWNKLS